VPIVPRRVDINVEQTRNEQARRLLPELGYAGTTTNHIAERAGVNVASLYEYFPGKDAIVAQVAERLVERVLGPANPPGTRDGGAQ